MKEYFEYAWALPPFLTLICSMSIFPQTIARGDMYVAIHLTLLSFNNVLAFFVILSLIISFSLMLPREILGPRQLLLAYPISKVEYVIGQTLLVIIIVPLSYTIPLLICSLTVGVRYMSEMLLGLTIATISIILEGLLILSISYLIPSQIARRPLLLSMTLAGFYVLKFIVRILCFINSLTSQDPLIFYASLITSPYACFSIFFTSLLTSWSSINVKFSMLVYPFNIISVPQGIFLSLVKKVLELSSYGVIVSVVSTLVLFFLACLVFEKYREVSVR